MNNKPIVSNGNFKLPNTPNFSQTPVLSCGRTSRECKSHCYALKSYRQYLNVKNVWDSNFHYVRYYPDMVFDVVCSYITRKRKTPKYFRVHVGGDFYNQKNIALWSKIARENTTTKFLAYTKRTDLNFAYVPKNLIIRQSYWGVPYEKNGLIRESTSNAKIAIANLPWEDTERFLIQSGIKKCTGKCGLSCRFCWNSDKPVYFNLH